MCYAEKQCMVREWSNEAVEEIREDRQEEIWK